MKEGSANWPRTDCRGDLGGPLESQIHHLALQPLCRLCSPPSNPGLIAHHIMQVALTGSQSIAPQARDFSRHHKRHPWL